MALVFWDMFRWLWVRGVAEYLRAWINIHWFLYHYFSVPVLLRSFFAPFHRLRERRMRGFDLEDWASVIAVNVLMRFVGMIVRSVFLLLALASELLLLLSGAVLFAFFATVFISVPLLIFMGIIFLF